MRVTGSPLIFLILFNTNALDLPEIAGAHDEPGSDFFLVVFSNIWAPAPGWEIRMPEAPLRLCATSGCPSRVKRGHCRAHQQRRDRRRRTDRTLTYSESWWLAWRKQFISELVSLGIAPVCGAALPDGPVTRDSRCKALGLLVFTSQDGSALHLDHEPALLEHERQDRDAVCTPLRIQLLCASCHSAKERPSWFTFVSPPGGE